MSAGCPGSDGRHLSADLYVCPHCGAEVEMFSDETRVKCHVCRGQVFKEAVPSCAQWCAQARQCLGEERWLALHPEETDTDHDPADQEKDSP